MLKPPNDFKRLSDRSAMDAETARIKAEAQTYRGRPDLLDLALAVVAELQALNSELVAAYREGRRARDRQTLLDRERAKAREYVVLDAAMDEATRAKFLALDAIAMATVE